MDKTPAIALFAALALLAGCGEENGGTGARTDETSHGKVELFCDSLAALFPENGNALSPEWEIFVAQFMGEADWARLSPLYRWESDLFGADWYYAKLQEDAYALWLDTLGSRMPLSSWGRFFAEKKKNALSQELDSVSISGYSPPVLPSTSERFLRMIAKLFQQSEEWEYSYFALKEELEDVYGMKPYTRKESGAMAMSEKMAPEYLRLAYLAWRGGKPRLAEKNYRIAKLLDAGVAAECNEKSLADADFALVTSNVVVFGGGHEDDGTAERFNPPISRTAALDSIRSLYLVQDVEQRVMWLAEQGLMKPLSTREQAKWADKEKGYCSHVSVPCWIMGSETDGPVGFGKALEEEWAAGD